MYSSSIHIRTSTLESQEIGLALEEEEYAASERNYSDLCCIIKFMFKHI